MYSFVTEVVHYRLMMLLHVRVYLYMYTSICMWLYSIYIYIYIYWQHFFINTNFVEHNRHFLSTYPLVLPYCFYRIRQELIDVFSIIVYIPSTSCSTLGHHQVRVNYKSDVTLVFAYYNYIKASLPLECIEFAFKSVSINSVCS